jgi:PAS domain S-box-containing protein
LLRLPTSSPDAAAGEAPSTLEARPSGRRGSLLIVDDSDANRDAMARLMTQKGYLVSVASDGHEAMRLLNDDASCDLVLLDVEMPGLGGLEVLERIRAVRSQTELPVIMVTGRSQGADVIEAFRLGANDYVVKPIDFPVACARIATHLAHKWAVEDLRESEQRYELAMRGANDGLWDWDLTRNEVFWSARWKAMLGYAEAELSGSPEEWFTRVHHEDLSSVKDSLAAHLSRKVGHHESEHRVLHRDVPLGPQPRRGGQEPERRRHAHRRLAH